MTKQNSNILKSQGLSTGEAEPNNMFPYKSQLQSVWVSLADRGKKHFLKVDTQWGIKPGPASFYLVGVVTTWY